MLEAEGNGSTAINRTPSEMSTIGPFGLRRAAKLSAGVAFVALGVLALCRTYVFTMSTDAAVTGAVVTIRSPIPGSVTLKVGAPGEVVQADQVVASVHNEWIDDSPLQALRARLASAQAERKALSELQSKLTEFRGDMAKDASAYRRSRLALVTAHVSQLTADLEGQRAKLSEAQQRRNRTESLFKNGLASAQDQESAVRDATALEHSVLASEALLGSAADNLAWARKGTNVDTTTDKPYSQQRGDELHIRLAELTSQMTSTDRRIKALTDELEAERARMDRRTDAFLSAQVKGRLWRRAAASGEFVREGEDLLEIVDCSRLFVAATVVERNLARIRIGTEATFTPSGSSRGYRAVVAQVMGSLVVPRGVIPETTPLPRGPSDAPLYRVTLVLDTIRDDDPLACTVGHTGNVRFHVNLFQAFSL